MKLCKRDKKLRKKYAGKLKLMIRSTPDNPEYVWATWDEIRYYEVFSYQLMRKE